MLDLLNGNQQGQGTKVQNVVEDVLKLQEQLDLVGGLCQGRPQGCIASTGELLQQECVAPGLSAWGSGPAVAPLSSEQITCYVAETI